MTFWRTCGQKELFPCACLIVTSKEVYCPAEHLACCSDHLPFAGHAKSKSFYHGARLRPAPISVAPEDTIRFQPPILISQGNSKPTLKHWGTQPMYSFEGCNFWRLELIPESSSSARNSTSAPVRPIEARAKLKAISAAVVRAAEVHWLDITVVLPGILLPRAAAKDAGPLRHRKRQAKGAVVDGKDGNCT